MPLPSGLKEILVNFGNTNQSKITISNCDLQRNKSYVKHSRSHYKNILILDGAMEPCCNGTISKKILGRTFQDFPHSLKGNNDLLSSATNIKDVHALF
jgi:hypothetical protein